MQKMKFSLSKTNDPLVMNRKKKKEKKKKENAFFQNPTSLLTLAPDK